MCVRGCRIYCLYIGSYMWYMRRRTKILRVLGSLAVIFFSEIQRKIIKPKIEKRS